MFRFFYTKEHWTSYTSSRFGLQRAALIVDTRLFGEYLIYDGSN